ncbi:MAG: antibiotic biosynthesis monooxygenase [Saprospiraceae bacterium]|nr:antibiotic biosynthesis monooxygenase [Saprospiraceae bacterium]
MIQRIVKMTFKEEHIADFLVIFEEAHHKISAFEGCHYLALLQDQQQPNVFFTHSHWESAAFLEHYRQSELFRTTWAKTKKLFADKPQAWSLQSVTTL